MSYFKRITLEDSQTGKQVAVESLGSLKTIIPTRLVGTTFNNGSKDTNFWTETVEGTGSVTQSGEIVLSTGVTADSTAKYETVRKGRKVTGTSNQFRATARNKTEAVADCIRRIGAYNANDGFFMQYDGTTFGIGVRKDGSDTIVNNGSFNGNAGDTMVATGTGFRKLVIEYTSISVKYLVDGILIHTVNATTESLTNSQDLNVTMEVINENGSMVDNQYEVLFATIIRLGKMETTPTYKALSGATDIILKRGAGTLHRVVSADASGDCVVYDGSDDTGERIANIDLQLGTLEFGCPFNNGLFIHQTGGSSDTTVIYE